MSYKKQTWTNNISTVDEDKMNYIEDGIYNVDRKTNTVTGAEEYNDEATYSVGDYCIYNNILYRAKTNTTGIWDASKWERTSIINEAEKSNNLEVHFLYRGDNSGDCMLIKAKDKNILLDLGGTNAATLINKLKEKNVSKVDYLILSHFHGDHCMGYTSNYDGQNFIDLLDSDIDFSNCIFIFPKNPDWNQFIYGDTADSKNRDIAGALYLPTLEANITNAINERSLTIIRPDEGDIINIDNETSIKFLNCDETRFIYYYDITFYNSGSGKYITNYNNFSMVAELTHKDHKFLFTGDLPIEAQAKISDELTYCDVLKVQHHGIGTAVNETYYKKISPKIAVVMENGYLTNTNKTLAGLRLFGTEIYSSNYSHDIVVTSTSSNLFAESDNGKYEQKENSQLAFLMNGIGGVSTLNTPISEYVIHANSDLNDYTTPGIYLLNSNLESIKNTPYDSQNKFSFKMIVEETINANRVKQTIYPVNSTDIYSRYIKVDALTYGNWELINSGNILFNLSSGGTSSDVTLSDSIQNYKEIEILYGVSGYHKSIKIAVNATSINIVLDGIYTGSQNMVIASQVCTLSGTKLTRGNSSAKNINLSTNAITNNDGLSFNIYKIIGY